MLLDATDVRILELLQEQGRITNAELAQRVGLSPGATLARVSKLELAGVISGFTAIMNREALGLAVTAFVAVILKTHGRQESSDFLAAVQGLPQVMECHHIAGDEDYLLKVVASSPAHFETFVLDELTSIPAVQRVKTTFVLSSPKVSTVVPILPALKEGTNERGAA